MDSASATTLSTTQEYRMAVGTRILESAAAAAADDFTDSSRSFVSDHFGLFIFLVACSISLVIMFSMIIREYYWRKYGVDVCPGTGPRGRSRNVASQIMSDQAMAVELQRQLNEEIREQERLEKRKERRAWYESYIKPYTMVSSKVKTAPTKLEELHPFCYFRSLFLNYCRFVELRINFHV